MSSPEKRPFHAASQTRYDLAVLLEQEDRSEMTARQIIEASLGKSLGPLATMPPDHRRAVKLLARELLRIKSGFRTTPDRRTAQ